MEKFQIKKILKLILIFVLILPLLFFLVFFFKSFREQNKLYHIPQINLYVKLHRGFYNDTVDVFFSHNKSGPFSYEHDYIKVSGKSPVDIIISSENPNELTLSSGNSGILKVCSKDFIIKQSLNEAMDTVYYHPQLRTEPLKLKAPYQSVVIDEGVEGVTLKQSECEYYQKIEVLK